MIAVDFLPQILRVEVFNFPSQGLNHRLQPVSFSYNAFRGFWVESGRSKMYCSAKPYHQRQAMFSLEIGAMLPTPHVAEQCKVETMGIMGAIGFCDGMSHWVQPPDAENRTSGGVAEVAGAIPSPRVDQ